jgi:hypothetical protein
MDTQRLVQMDAQGRVVLPQEVRGKRKKYFSCQTEKDGTIHLIPVVGVLTPKQVYFWTKRWQKGEKEATEALKKGKYKKISPQKLNDYLDSL